VAALAPQPKKTEVKIAAAEKGLEEFAEAGVERAVFLLEALVPEAEKVPSPNEKTTRK